MYSVLQRFFIYEHDYKIEYYNFYIKLDLINNNNVQLDDGDHE